MGYILALEVYAPTEGIIALRGAELDSSHRFQLPHVLTEKAVAGTVPLTLTDRKGVWELVQATVYKVVIQRDPFLLTVWAGNTVQATINGRKLFTIEHLRAKQVCCLGLGVGIYLYVHGCIHTHTHTHTHTHIYIYIYILICTHYSHTPFTRTHLCTLLTYLHTPPISTHTQEGDPSGWWEEDFKSHKDTKPRGPQSLSLDIDLPVYNHVYGIPEHASSFALEPTVGVL